ncbi:MAG: VOC family protein [Steroidobacteraceae bacterium]
MSAPLKRVTLWVRDLERALLLYRDALGLAILEEKSLEGPAIARMVGLDSARLRIVHLGMPGAEHGWIGLYEIGASSPRPMGELPTSSGFPLYGQTTLVFEVANLDLIHARLASIAGLEVLAGPTSYLKAEASAAMPAGRYSELIFRDPDGIIVSLLGYSPL